MRVFPADARKESIHQRFLSPLPYDGSGSVGVKREEEKKTRYPAPGISPRRWILTRNCPARSPSLTASQKGSGTSPGREKGKHSHSSRYTGADPPPAFRVIPSNFRERVSFTRKRRDSRRRSPSERGRTGETRSGKVAVLQEDNRIIRISFICSFASGRVVYSGKSGVTPLHHSGLFCLTSPALCLPLLV